MGPGVAFTGAINEPLGGEHTGDVFVCALLFVSCVVFFM